MLGDQVPFCALVWPNTSQQNRHVDLQHHFTYSWPEQVQLEAICWNVLLERRRPMGVPSGKSLTSSAQSHILLLMFVARDCMTVCTWIYTWTSNKFGLIRQFLCLIVYKYLKPYNVWGHSGVGEKTYKLINTMCPQHAYGVSNHQQMHLHSFTIPLNICLKKKLQSECQGHIAWKTKGNKTVETLGRSQINEVETEPT